MNKKLSNYNGVKSCLICRKNLIDSDVIFSEIRDDISKKAKAVTCKHCKHVQLVDYNYNFDKHYELNSQDSSIKKNFNKNDYDIFKSSFSISKDRINRLDSIFNVKLDETSKTIDIGSGIQIFPFHLEKKYNCSVESIEISKERINFGKKFLNIDNFNFKIYNQHLNQSFVDENKEKYDLVTLHHVLEHVENIHELVKFCYDLLKPGGKLIIETPNEDDYLLKFEKYKKIMYQIHHLSYFRDTIFEKICNDLNIKNYKIIYHHRYNIKNFMGWILGNNYKTNAGEIGTTDKELNDFWFSSLAKIKGTDCICLVIQK